MGQITEKKFKKDKMKKLIELKKFFKIYKLDGYLVPKNDEYFNEYVSSANERLKFISNFSGSAGFALILKNRNYLFVDGRYTVQARIQSAKNFKMQEKLLCSLHRHVLLSYSLNC